MQISPTVIRSELENAKSTGVLSDDLGLYIDQIADYVLSKPQYFYCTEFKSDILISLVKACHKINLQLSKNPVSYLVASAENSCKNILRDNHNKPKLNHDNDLQLNMISAESLDDGTNDLYADDFYKLRSLSDYSLGRLTETGKPGLYKDSKGTVWKIERFLND